MTIYSPFTSWFDRCVGSWNSDRRYLYDNARGSTPHHTPTRRVPTTATHKTHEYASRPHGRAAARTNAA